MKRILKAAALMITTAALFFHAGQADAHGGRWKGKRGKKHCAKMLMVAPSKVLKKRVGLNDTQITTLKTLRTDFKKQMIPLKAKIKLIRVDMKNLLDTENVDQQKVLALVEQINTLKGQLKILKVKTKLQIRALLTAEQREKLHKSCRKRMRRFGRWGRGGHGCQGHPGCWQGRKFGQYGKRWKQSQSSESSDAAPSNK